MSATYNPYLTSQLSGPTAQAGINAVQNEYTTLINPLLEYFYGLSINTADATDLASIGYLVGLPWPVAPAGTFSVNSLSFSSAATFPDTSATGFGAADGSIVGGLFTDASSATGTLIPISLYRMMLVNVAYLKYNGLSLTAIDKVCAGFVSGPLAGTYTFLNEGDNLFTFGLASAYPEYNNMEGFADDALTVGGELASAELASDITIGFTPSISSGNLWVLQYIFNFVCTSPQVFVQNGDD